MSSVKLYKLCKLYELCTLYEHSVNHLQSVEIVGNHLIFVFKKFDFFSLMYKNEKSKLQKQKYCGKIFK